MASYRTYREKLLDPRWQRKRLEVLNRADFSCRRCGTRTETLHVHHGYYEKDVEPWDYPMDSLHCLCEFCHEIEQGLLAAAHRRLGRMLPQDIEAMLAIMDYFLLSYSPSDHGWPLVAESAAAIAGLEYSTIYEVLAARDQNGVLDYPRLCEAIRVREGS